MYGRKNNLQESHRLDSGPQAWWQIPTEPSHWSHLDFWDKASFWDLTEKAILIGQLTLGIHLFPTLQYWCYKFILSYLPFYVGTGKWHAWMTSSRLIYLPLLSTQFYIRDLNICWYWSSRKMDIASDPPWILKADSVQCSGDNSSW